MTFLRRLDFSIRKESLLGLAWFLLIPFLYLLPEHAFTENSYIENFQLVILFATAVVSLKFKDSRDGKLFVFAFMFFIILFLREVNCFRVLFPIEGKSGSFMRWEQIIPNYGFLIPLAYRIFIACAVGYLVFGKAGKIAVEYMKKARIPVVETALIVIGAIVLTVAEQFHNEALEELFETLIYIALATIIWIYGHDKRFALREIP